MPFHVHEIDGYWNDVGTLREYVNGNLDAVAGKVHQDMHGELIEGERTLDGGAEAEGPVLIGPGAEIGSGAQLSGPLIVGPGARIGSGARVAEAVLLPGAEIAAGAVVARGLVGGADALAAMDW